MKVLVVGYGSMGKRHARHAQELGHHVFVNDASPVRIAEAIRDHYPTIRASSIRDGVDAVVIASPAETHSTLLKTFNACRRILVEKPVALSVKDYYDTRMDSPQLVGDALVGYQFRFQPHVRQLRELVNAARPRFAVLHLACDMSDWPGATYADALLECSHEVDLAQYLFGPAECVRARFRQDISEWVLDLWCGGQTLASLRINTAARGRYERFVSVFGASDTGYPRYEWAWHAPSGTSFLHAEGQGDEMTVGIGEAVYKEELRSFLDGDWYDHGCSLYEGLSVLRVCDDARKLAQLETVVRS